jgi:outer membrane protein assembly factor BamB
MKTSRLLAVLMAAGCAHAQWAQFRGPNGSGVGAETGYPVEFSPEKNFVWKAAVAYGQSSPVIAGDRVFLTASEGDRFLTICLDARTGQELWRKNVRRERTTKLFRANDPASPTPVADEGGVVSFFPDYGFVAYAPDGKLRWSQKLGPFTNFYGMAASPILARDMVVLVCDQQSGSYILALDRNNGHQRWKTDRPGMTVGWATPMVFKATNGREDLIVLGSTRLDGYSLTTGERNWWTPIGSSGALGTPLSYRELLLVSTAGSSDPMLPKFEVVLAKYDKNKDGKLSLEEFQGDPDLGEHFGWIDANSDNFIDAQEWNAAREIGNGPFGAVAIRTDKANGKLEPNAIRWRYSKSLPMIPAPLVYEDVFYMVKDGGVVTSLNPANGQLLKQGRSPEALGEYYASPVAADGKVFLANADGKVTVLKSGGQWEVLKVNDLGEEIRATPALAGGHIYVRTKSALYCFGKAF